jgi:hypothetical protein
MLSHSINGYEGSEDMQPTARRMCAALIVTLLFAAAHAQESATPPPTVQRAATDPVIGAWKLNVDKSTNPPAAAELITVAPQGSSFKLTFDIKQDNGYNPIYEVVTDMKGATVKPAYADGKQTNDAWSVTRRGQNAFEMQLSGPFGGWTDDYEVNADGKTLTLRRMLSKAGAVVGQPDRAGIGHSANVIAIFERVR